MKPDWSHHQSSPPAIPSVDISFYLFNENSPFYTTLTEGVEVQYSLDNITWNDVQLFSRQDVNLASGTGQWEQKYLTLPAAVGNLDSVFIGFKFHSDFGDNVSFDNLHIYATPACSSLPTAVDSIQYHGDYGDCLMDSSHDGAKQWLQLRISSYRCRPYRHTCCIRQYYR
jgi:hypothetical protein